VLYLIVNRGDMVDVKINDEGEFEAVFNTWDFPSAQLADMAYEEMVLQNPGWPLERRDVEESNAIRAEDHE